jgi:aryl-alcohol dehydrogenase-like predicted oxidoreductase
MEAMMADAESPMPDRFALAARFKRIHQLVRDLQVPAPGLALRYLLSDSQFASVIPGARFVDHVHSNIGAAHGALAMTTPGDTSMATMAEVNALVRRSSARISR